MPRSCSSTPRKPMRRLRDSQAGSALVVALGVLLVVTLLTGVVFAAVLQMSAATNGDANGRRALQAADAGLRVAVYRINMLQPTDAACVTNAAVAPVGGQCPGYSQGLGNGASYTYYTTPVLGPTDTCAGMTVQSQTAVSQRCVTSIGTANSVVKRTQERVGGFAGTPLFASGGILGLK